MENIKSSNISLLSSWFRTGHRSGRTARIWKIVYCAAIISTTAGIFASAAGGSPLLPGLREVYRQGRNSATRDKLYSTGLIQVLQGSTSNSGSLLSSYREINRPNRTSRIWQALHCTPVIQAIQGSRDTGKQSLLPRAWSNRVDSSRTCRIWTTLRSQTHNQTVQGPPHYWVSVLSTHRARYRCAYSSRTRVTSHSSPVVQDLSLPSNYRIAVLQIFSALYTSYCDSDLYGNLTLHTDLATGFEVCTDPKRDFEVSAEIHQEGKV